MTLLNWLNNVAVFIESDLFLMSFLILCGGGIAIIFLMALWDWWNDSADDMFSEIDFTDPWE